MKEKKLEEASPSKTVLGLLILFSNSVSTIRTHLLWENIIPVHGNRLLKSLWQPQHPQPQSSRTAGAPCCSGTNTRTGCPQSSKMLGSWAEINKQC